MRMSRNKEGVWYATAQLITGRTHNFAYLVHGKPLGGADNVPQDAAGKLRKVV